MTSPAARVSTKETDYLDQDDPIRGQNYVCMSFVSPEEALKNKDVFIFSEFTKHFAKDIDTMLENLKLKFEGNSDVAEMVNLIKNRHDYLWTDDAMQSEYAHFKDTNSARLESEFYEKNEFQTSIRGFKVRGVYESDKEARNRVEQLRRKDKNHNIFIAQVGCWCPWSPNPNDIQDQEYAETELNTLMKKYRENLDARDKMYQERFETLREQAEAEAKAQREAKADAASSSTSAATTTQPTEEPAVPPAAADSTAQDSTAQNTLEAVEGEDPWIAKQTANVSV